MKSADLSVVMSNYNHARYLPRALGAILQQSVRPQELIVVDDGSTDDSLAVLDDFARRDPIIRVIRHERNVGVCEAVTRGVRAATGEFLLYAAADDYILPGMIEKSLDMLRRHPSAGMSYGYCSVLEESTGVLRRPLKGWLRRAGYLSPDRLAASIGSGCIPSTSAIYRRLSIERAGGYLADLCWHCDWFMNLAIGFREGVCRIPRSLAVITASSKNYSFQGMRDEHAMNQVVAALLRHLHSPTYRDLVPYFARSGVLEEFVPQLTRFAAVCAPFNTPLFNTELQEAARKLLAPLQTRPTHHRWQRSFLSASARLVRRAETWVAHRSAA